MTKICALSNVSLVANSLNRADCLVLTNRRLEYLVCDMFFLFFLFFTFERSPKSLKEACSSYSKLISKNIQKSVHGFVAKEIQNNTFTTVVMFFSTSIAYPIISESYAQTINCHVLELFQIYSFNPLLNIRCNNVRR